MVTVRRHKRKGRTVRRHKRRVKKRKKFKTARKKGIFFGESDTARLYTDSDKPDDIFISDWPEAEVWSEEDVAEKISHEEMHNILGKEIGQSASAGLDLITAPTLSERGTGLIMNSETAGKIFHSYDEMKEAFEEEIERKDISIGDEEGNIKEHLDFMEGRQKRITFLDSLELLD